VDDKVFRQIRQGDKAAFALLVQRYQRPLFAYLGRMGLEQSLAEEIAQETFVRVWQSAARFDPARSAFSTWIFTIARRLAINELERASRRYEQATGAEQGVESAQYANPAQLSPAEVLQQSEQQQALWQALQTLSVHERSLLALAYLSELEFSAIAAIEQIPVGTVKSRLHRIRQQLKTYLTRNE
jgi:RNA polymerase sigma-70 factor (ECF subfamily)